MWQCGNIPIRLRESPVSRSFLARPLGLPLHILTVMALEPIKSCPVALPSPKGLWRGLACSALALTYPPRLLARVLLLTRKFRAVTLPSLFCVVTCEQLCIYWRLKPINDWAEKETSLSIRATYYARVMQATCNRLKWKINNPSHESSRYASMSQTEIKAETAQHVVVMFLGCHSYSRLG